MKNKYLQFTIACVLAVSAVNTLSAQSRRFQSELYKMSRLAQNKVTQTVNREVCAANFMFTGNSVGQQLIVAFSNTSVVEDFTQTVYSWDFGDGQTDVNPAPVHTFDVNFLQYVVCLTVTNVVTQCTSTYCDTLNVSEFYVQEPCNASYGWSHDPSASNIVYFGSYNPGNFNYSWDFGDGTPVISGYDAYSATHGFAQSGTYQVCLTVTDTLNDCNLTECQSVVAQDILAGGTGSVTINQLPNIETSIQNILFGNCVDVSNIQFNGSTSQAIGYLSDSTSVLGFDFGLLLTTGTIFNAIGPNNQTGAGTQLSLPGDPLLDQQIPGYYTMDAVSIEFDFVPQADTVIACEFVFASEEYPEFVGTQYNDVFGFFIQGPEDSLIGLHNIAFLPGTTTPIAINNVSDALNSQYYVDNTNGQILQYDGYTTPISLQYPVTPGQSYHFKIVIADAGDGIFDSGVFLKGGSFLGNTPLPAARFAYNADGLAVQFQNLSLRSDTYSWEFGDGATASTENPSHTYDQPGIYNVRMGAGNMCYNRDTTITVAVTTTGILEMDKALNYKLVPNGNGQFNLSYALMNNSDLQLEVISMSGQLLFSKSLKNASFGNEMIDLSVYASGIYQLRLRSNSSVETIKFLK
jgi:PKD repeat protein